MNMSTFKLQAINKPTLPLHFSEHIILQMEFSIKRNNSDVCSPIYRELFRKINMSTVQKPLWESAQILCFTEN